MRSIQWSNGMSAAALNEALELIQKNNLGLLDCALSLLHSTVILSVRKYAVMPKTPRRKC